jgi:hypothetical protein
MPKRHNPDVGRPTLLTLEVRQRVERALADAVPVNVTAQRVGVGERTWHRWISEGKVRRPGRQAAADDWRAAAAVLERAFPERWGAPRGGVVHEPRR